HRQPPLGFLYPESPRATSRVRSQVSPAHHGRHATLVRTEQFIHIAPRLPLQQPVPTPPPFVRHPDYGDPSYLNCILRHFLSSKTTASRTTSTNAPRAPCATIAFRFEPRFDPLIP